MTAQRQCGPGSCCETLLPRANVPADRLPNLTRVTLLPLATAAAVNMGASFGMTCPSQGRPAYPRIGRTSIDTHRVRSLPYSVPQGSGNGAAAPHTRRRFGKIARL